MTVCSLHSYVGIHTTSHFHFLNDRFEFVLQVLIRIARAEAIAARYSYVIICVLRTEEDLGFYDNAINSSDAAKESVVTFGPWKAAPLVEDLLDCVKMDIESQGYRVSIQPHAVQQGFLSRSYRNYFHQLTFTWW